MLDHFFNPSSVAVVGASQTPGKIGYDILNNILQHGYRGAVYPINPKAKEILGDKVCVAGNVPPTGAFLTGTPEDVINEANACIEAWGEGGGYILTLGCDFPKTIPIENVMALMSLKKE